jgi:hypothetical protein
MSIPVPQPVQPATDLSESDYWLGFEASKTLFALRAAEEVRAMQFGIAEGELDAEMFQEIAQTLLRISDATD